MTSQIPQFFSMIASTTSRFGDIFMNREAKARYIFTPIEEAVREIEKRRHDTSLRKKVEDYIHGEIPAHFHGPKPFFCLSRYLATPNFELLYALDRIKKFNLPLVITEDTKNLFISHSELKRALAKLPVVKGISRHDDEIIEYFTIVDFKKYHGLPLNEIETKCNESLVAFHRSLMTQMSFNNVIVADETEWVDSHHRDDVEKQYKQMLALFCLHGIMLETYPPAEREFALKVVYPALREVESELGMKPLIVEHITDDEDAERDWNAYPTELYDYINSKCVNSPSTSSAKKI